MENVIPVHNYLREPRGLKSWLLTRDHKRIGVMYMWAILFAFCLGGVVALGIRLELLTPGGDMMSADTYNKMFTLHGTIMVFLFIIPSIPATFGNFVLPLMIGAKDVAFPRLNLASWYLYVIGTLVVIYSVLVNSVDTGWTFYTPYSSGTSTAVVAIVTGVFILGFSSIFTGLNFIVTVHKLRAPGMTWFKMPLMIWALYATAIIQVLATPVLGITLILLVLERVMSIGIFDPAMGGDPVLFQHFFWFYSHPAVYIMILPGMGIISELISCFSRKTIFGYNTIAFSSVAIALIGFLVWGHHMFTSGQSEVVSLIFSALTFLVGIPTAIKVFNWTTTMYKGQISFEAPMLYAMAFLCTFTIGGLTGLFLGTLSVNVFLHDTYFVVAHFHYTMMGGTVMAMLGGLHYWWPKIFGRMYNRFWACVAAIFVVVGFNCTFLPLFVVGSQGMPRRYFEYVPDFQGLQVAASIGAGIMTIGFVIMGIYLFRSFRHGRPAGDNPWGALTLEWEQTTSPPLPHNFASTPVITHGPYAYDDVVAESTL